MSLHSSVEDGFMEGDFVKKGADFRSPVHFGWQNENDVAELIVLDHLVAERRNAAAAAGEDFKKLKVLTVTGGCDVTLSLLARSDVIASVDAGDVNAAQGEMLILKAAAAAHCPGGVPGLCRFLGLDSQNEAGSCTSELAEERKRLYKEHLRGHLPPEMQKAWDSRLDKDIAYGACAAACGSTFYASLRATLASKGFTEEDILGGKLARRVAQLDANDDQAGLAQLRRTLLECCPFTMMGLVFSLDGTPFWPTLKETLGHAFGPVFINPLFWWWRKEAASGLFGELASKNVVMSMAFAGKLAPPSVSYQWLTEENLKSIYEGGVSRLSTHVGDIAQTAQKLCQERGEKFDLFTISNIAEGQSIAKFRPSIEQLRSCLSPGGYLVSRRFSGGQDALFEGLMELPSVLNKEIILKSPGTTDQPFSLVVALAP